MATASAQPESIFDACDRFFGIAELVTLFLEQTTTRDLLCCQRVCQAWNSIIRGSDTLQQHLFLQAAPSDTEPVINPVIEDYFTILADSWNCYAVGARGRNINSAYRLYKDMIYLPCARDGRLENATARRAFVRREASWRDMLVCQPPICRLDWWHVWGPPAGPSWGRASGWGHQDLNDTAITIGMLWDLAESRMARGCGVRVLYFPTGKSMDNECSCDQALEWWRLRPGQHRGLKKDMPRVEIQSRQVWNGSVTGREVFDMNTFEWVAPTGTQRERHCHQDDGFNVLRNDCRRDHEGVCEGQLCHGREQHPLSRWSRSEGFAWAEIDGESSGHD